MERMIEDESSNLTAVCRQIRKIERKVETFN